MSKFGILKTPFGGANHMKLGRQEKFANYFFLNLCVKFNQHRLKN